PRGHREEVTSVAFSPDGNRIFGWARGGNVRAWTVADGRPTDPAEAPADSSRLVASSPSGSLRAEAHGPTIFLLDPVAVDRDRAERLALKPANRIFSHQQQAKQAQRDANWFATTFHLRQLCRDRPDDANLALQLAIAQLSAGDEPGYRRTCRALLAH